MAEEKEGYPIRAVSQLTGLSIDTLRAWERRYEAVTPQRQGRGRLYSEADIERLSLLKEAVDRGHSIGRLAPMTNEQLIAMRDRSSQLSVRPEQPVGDGALSQDCKKIIGAIDRFDYMEVDREMNRLATLLTPQDLINRVMVPVMKTVGEQWHAGRFTIAQEHMFSSILHNLLGSLIRLYTRDNPSCTLMFAALEGEQHEFGIMAAAMMAARGGLGIVYLGAGIPASDLLAAAEKGGVNAVVVGVKGINNHRVTLSHLADLAQDLPVHVELWIGGDMTDALQQAIERPSGRAVIMDSFDRLEQHLIRMGAQF